MPQGQASDFQNSTLPHYAPKFRANLREQAGERCTQMVQLPLPCAEGQNGRSRSRQRKSAWRRKTMALCYRCHVAHHAFGGQAERRAVCIEWRIHGSEGGAGCPRKRATGAYPTETRIPACRDAGLGERHAAARVALGQAQPDAFISGHYGPSNAVARRITLRIVPCSL
jgi:hypothetical protein